MRDPGCQLSVHALLFPSELLDVLRPLKVGDDHPAGVGEDIGHDQRAALRQRFVSLGRKRVVGSFDDDIGANGVTVGGRNCVTIGRRDEDVALEREKLLIADGVGCWELLDEASIANVVHNRSDVEAMLVVDPTRDVADSNYWEAGFLRDSGGPGTDVAKALDRD